MKFLIVFGSINGHTETMAGFIAEGIRIGGGEADVKVFSQVREPEDFAGYDGYVFGGPTYHKDLLHGMKAWLFKAKEGGLEGKVGGAFGSHTHSGEAPGILYDTMLHVFNMNMVDLGPFKMVESVIGTPAGLKDCQQYGKALLDRASA
ncbi:MAG: flavodoxin domain-containing protein [Thermoleophilia bacterium]